MNSIVRSFSSTPAVCRAPALADITPEGVTSFEAKQKEFRAKLQEDQNKKEISAFTDKRDSVLVPGCYLPLLQCEQCESSLLMTCLPLACRCPHRA